MKLADYLRKLTPEERESYAANCKTTVGYLYLLAGGHRATRHWRVELLEKHSGNEVTRHDLYPAVYGESATAEPEARAAE